MVSFFFCINIDFFKHCIMILFILTTEVFVTAPPAGLNFVAKEGASFTPPSSQLLALTSFGLVCVLYE